MAYQRKVGRFLSQFFDEACLHEGQWLKFVDDNGLGYAQPDFYILGPYSTIVIEAKLSERGSAETQIDKLYRPILRHLYGKPVVGVQVCKYLTPLTAVAVKTLDHIMDLVDDQVEQYHIWHWLG